MNTFPPMRHFVHTYVGYDDRSGDVYEALMSYGEINDIIDRLALLLVETTDEFIFSFPRKCCDRQCMHVMIKSDYGNAKATVDFSSIACTSWYELSCELGDHPIRELVIRLLAELVNALPMIKTMVARGERIRVFNFTMHYNPKTIIGYNICVYARY